MGVGVEGDGDGGVAQKLLDELGVDVLREQDRSAGVAEAVEGDGGEPGPREQLSEGPLPEVEGINGVADLPGEDEALVIIEAAGLELLFGLARPVAL